MRPGVGAGPQPIRCNRAGGRTSARQEPSSDGTEGVRIVRPTRTAAAAALSAVFVLSVGLPVLAQSPDARPAPDVVGLAEPSPRATPAVVGFPIATPEPTGAVLGTTSATLPPTDTE